MSALSLAVAACLIGITASTCATADNTNCANWVRNGFCASSAYTTAQKQAYCPYSCVNAGCGASVATTTVIPTTDVNAHCAAWAGNAAKPFCLNTLTAAQKRQYCATTCAFEIAPNADCAIYTVANNALTRVTPTNRTGPPAVAVPITLAAGATITRAYVGATCSLALFTAAAPTVAAETKVGTAGPFQTVTTATTAATYTCSCT